MKTQFNIRNFKDMKLILNHIMLQIIEKLTNDYLL